MNLKYLLFLTKNILLFLTECFLLSFCSQGSVGSSVKKEKKKKIFIMEILKSGNVLKPRAILFLPHPTHILSAAGSKPRGEGSVLGRVRQINPFSPRGWIAAALVPIIVVHAGI